MMDLVLCTTSDVPLYQQLCLQISAQIVNGVLLPGTPLPPIRTVAAELGVSIITVKRAWEELERSGFIHTHVGRGTVVAPRDGTDPDEKKLAIAREKLERDLAFYRTLGLSKAELQQLIDTLY